MLGRSRGNDWTSEEDGVYTCKGFRVRSERGVERGGSRKEERVEGPEGLNVLRDSPGSEFGVRSESEGTGVGRVRKDEKSGDMSSGFLCPDGHLRVVTVTVVVEGSWSG